MVPKRDSKPILVKFPLGISEEDGRNKLYDKNWQTVYALISDPSGTKKENLYGSDFDFDKVITVNAGAIARKIDYDTAILIDEMPTSLLLKGDYSVKYIFPEFNKEIVIGLSRKEAIKFPRLYFYNNGKLLFSQMNYDNDLRISYCNKRQYVPFAVGDFVWTREPDSEVDTKHRLRVSSIEKVGFDSKYKPFFKITFVES